MLDKDNTIEVQGARVHNLKNIDVSIPVKNWLYYRSFQVQENHPRI
jgi:hypothetical protein